MDYEEKLKRMDEHLKKHPTDYQTVISRLKVISDAYEHQRREKQIRRLKRLAIVRKARSKND